MRKHPVILESMEFPEPVISVAVEPKTKADQDKMGIALQNLQKKILLSVLILIKKQDKQSSLVWVNFTLKLLLTVCIVNLKLKLMLVHPSCLPRNYSVNAAEVEGKFIRQSGGTWSIRSRMD